jgi:y4mF family transcriptional regulator
MESAIITFIKQERKRLQIDQITCAKKAGVSLNFLRNLEQGKKTARMDKVNMVLKLFGAELGVIRSSTDL